MVRRYNRAGRIAPGAWVVVLLALVLPGCAEFGYNQVQLGQEQRVYQAAFPEDSTRRSPAGVCCLETDGAGRTDAAVLLLTPDRRVAGKFYATHVERHWARPQMYYRLRGELDPRLMNLGATGPIDALRAVADELTATEGDTFVRDAHAWVAAGLLRLIQHWPHVGDEGPGFPRVSQTLERIPAGGEARITVDARGVYMVEYAQSSAGP